MRPTCTPFKPLYQSHKMPLRFLSCGSSVHSPRWVYRLLSTPYLRLHSQAGVASSIIGVGYHDRGHRRPERAGKEASCVGYSIRPTRDCHHVRTHPRALHVPTTDEARGPSCLCLESCGVVASPGRRQWHRARGVIVHERSPATRCAR